MKNTHTYTHIAGKKFAEILENPKCDNAAEKPKMHNSWGLMAKFYQNKKTQLVKDLIQ